MGPGLCKVLSPFPASVSFPVLTLTTTTNYNYNYNYNYTHTPTHSSTERASSPVKPTSPKPIYSTNANWSPPPTRRLTSPSNHASSWRSAQTTTLSTTATWYPNQPWGLHVQKKTTADHLRTRANDASGCAPNLAFSFPWRGEHLHLLASRFAPDCWSQSLGLVTFS